MQFYPSVNTSFFNINEHPLVSNTVDGVLEKLGGDDILERLKRPNSKWNIDSIYEYVLLTTPLEEIPIGASITLPDFIKKSKGIFSLENIPNNMCLWYCLARHKFSDLQLDRLATKAKELFKSYYTFKPDQSYCGVEMQELDTIENHFDVNINVYRFNGTKAVMERHSKKTFESTLTYNDASRETQEQLEPNYKSKKLIGSMFGKKMMFPTELLKWYLEHRLIVTNITYAVKYERSNERRARDTNPNHKLRGDIMKLIGNAPYGKCIMNFLKHETVKIVGQDTYNKNVRRNNYLGHQDLVEGYEFRFSKTSFKQSLSLHIGFQVYQLAKLRMLQFYYDFIDYYVDRSDFQYCIMDTDSAYFAISGDSLQDVVKPHLFNEFQQQKKYWFGRDDTPANKLYDSRTPGLFKLEYKGDCVISLASKMHYCDEKKFSSKGISKNQNEITKQKYLNALSGNGGQEFINNGFRSYHNQMNTYSLTNTAIKLFNDKQLRVGYETFPTKL
ncbi:hypothetical protein BATDEDRAFT_25157 [Batrachochytrium dendrobatidis JAM81]|uniref:DNA-directed DNA polymerase n=1 Tax=Batrachochytrium dendrobatidis (strain JAM81 / FGSC 10211) TaxID=684364 RepID=F4P2Y1_BATDJ|nr:uncharacterized protein BATDEDRAFT_25157 [Batrachochytrium dendrobatidis JAM81]EGF80262.1 hypothetical protein BATDEDRAFT_25157 [Batrachochytrium dendrobatidis JAM81]|eukprot:XP_006679043.1 hypothetical protein BATDEDRAFT_25157 [Batrachochytrium dendrobatidis JAM81]